jgi:hypothetical protein
LGKTNHFDLSQMQQNHTEANLLNSIINTFSAELNNGQVRHVTLASARDPCTPYLMAIAAFHAWNFAPITVWGYGAQYNRGVPYLPATRFA